MAMSACSASANQRQRPGFGRDAFALSASVLGVLLTVSVTMSATLERGKACRGGRNYLLANQETDGSWKTDPDLSSSQYTVFCRVGATAFAILALTREWRILREDNSLASFPPYPDQTPDAGDPPDVQALQNAIKRGVDFLTTREVSAATGSSIYSAEYWASKVYETALAIMALVATKNPVHVALVKKAAAFLESCQWGATPSTYPYPNGTIPLDLSCTLFRGGFDYIEIPSPDDNWSWYGERPDLSNTEFALDGLRAATSIGWTQTNPQLWKWAKEYVSACQNRTSTSPVSNQYAINSGHSDNNGGFRYWADWAHPDELADVDYGSYGSMTAAGVVSLYLCTQLGSSADPRIADALTWFKNNYSYQTNPKAKLDEGMIYGYYLWMAARASTYLNLNQIPGVTHRNPASDGFGGTPGWFYDFGWELTHGGHQPDPPIPSGPAPGYTCAWKLPGEPNPGEPQWRCLSTALAMLVLRGIEPLEYSTDAIAAWQHQNPTTKDWDIYYSYFDRQAGSWWTSTWSMPDGNDHDPAIAFNRMHEATTVWAHDLNQKYAIFGSTQKAGGWTTPYQISNPTGDAEDMDPAVAFDEDGTGLCTWVRVFPDPNPNNPGGIIRRVWTTSYNGTAWSTSPTVISNLDSCSLPEIAFTSVPSTASNPITPHKAICIWVGRLATSSVMYNIWDGAGWSAGAGIPGQAVQAQGERGGYLYRSNPSLPARCRLSLSADNQGKVIAVWQGVDSKLYSAVFNVALNQWVGGVTLYQNSEAREPTVAYGPNNVGTTNEVVSTFPRHTSSCIFSPWPLNFAPTMYGALLTPPSALVYSQSNVDYDPRVAWLPKTKTSALSVWSHAQTEASALSTEIWYSRWNDDDLNAIWVWTPAKPVVKPNTLWQSLVGLDMNPDVATPGGSHTMPPH